MYAKMKELGPMGGVHPVHPLDPPMIMLDQHNLQQILGPLMKEFKLLRETIDKNYIKLDEVQKEISSHQKEVSQDLQNLGIIISTQRREEAEEIGEKLEYTNKKWMQ